MCKRHPAVQVHLYAVCIGELLHLCNFMYISKMYVYKLPVQVPSYFLPVHVVVPVVRKDFSMCARDARPVFSFLPLIFSLAMIV